jgi:hypothetical protein
MLLFVPYIVGRRSLLGDAAEALNVEEFEKFQNKVTHRASQMSVSSRLRHAWQVHQIVSRLWNQDDSSTRSEDNETIEGLVAKAI